MEIKLQYLQLREIEGQSEVRKSAVILCMKSICTSTFDKDNFGFMRFVHRVGSTEDLYLIVQDSEDLKYLSFCHVYTML